MEMNRPSQFLGSHTDAMHEMETVTAPNTASMQTLEKVWTQLPT